MTTIQSTAPAAIQAQADNEIHRVNLREFLRSANGSLVGLEFTKLDGSERKMAARLGVRKHLKGGVNTVEAQDRPYMVMFDMQAKGYRAVNLATVSCVRANRRVYRVVG